MRKAWIMAAGGFVVLAGCGRMLDIQPDPSLATDDGGSAGDARADDAEASVLLPGDGGIPGTLCPPTGLCVLATGLQDLGSIAVSGDNVYFARHQEAGAILQVPTSGGPVTTFQSNANLPAALYATPAALYWITEGDNGIARHTFGMATADSTNGTTSPTAQIVGIGSETFWTIPGGGVSSGLVYRSTDFGPGTAIAFGANRPTALAVDSNYVYYATKPGDANGHIVRLAHNGLAVVPSTQLFQEINAIALSNAGVAAVTSLGGVWRTSTLGDMLFTNAWVQVSTNSSGIAMVADDATGTLHVLEGLDILEVIPPPMSSAQHQTIPLGCSGGRALAQDAAHLYVACQDSIVRMPK